MTRDLPSDTDAALAAVAAGWGREPTHAHPDCRCGRPKPALPAPPPVIDGDGHYVGSDDPAWAKWQAARREYGSGVYGAGDCLMHGRTR